MLTTSSRRCNSRSLLTFVKENNFAAVRSYCRSISNEESVKDFRDIPGPFALPVVGNMYLYKLGIHNIFEYHNVLKKFHDKYGRVMRERFGKRTIVHVFHPDDVKIVHSVEGKIPEVPPLQETTQLYRQKRNLSLGLGNTNGDEWYKLRKAVQQMMLRPKEVYHYLPLVDEVAQDLVKKIRSSLDPDGALPDLRNVISKWSMESSAMVCFERRLGCLDTNEDMADKMIEANKDIFVIGGLLKFSLPLFKYFPTPKWTKFLKAEDFFYKNATTYVNETISKINDLISKGELGENQYNFMSYLLSRKALSQKDVAIIALSLFADGLSTTSPSLVFNLYCLAKYPEVQEKVYQEVLKHMPKDNKLTVETLNNLQLLKAAVKETFRLYPIGTETSRIIARDIILGNYKIPSGTHVDLNQFVYFRSPEYFSEPEKYQPERWLRESQGSGGSTGAWHPYLLIPFGHGTRMCAGRRFAEQDLYTSISRILQAFRVELVDPSHVLEQHHNTLLVPKHPLHLRFIPRQTSQ